MTSIVSAIDEWVGLRHLWSWAPHAWRPVSTVYRQTDGSILFEGRRATILLWALAVEVDEHQATRTGEQVCRACSGSGEVIFWQDLQIDHLGHLGPDGYMQACTRINALKHEPSTIIDRPKALGWATTDGAHWILGTRDIAGQRTVIGEPCDCDPEKIRPVTVSLARMVLLMATLGDAPYGPLPPAWEVRLDSMEQAGWHGIDGAPAWVCRWWRAFAEWSIAGKEPDVEALAADLAERTRARRERIAAARARAFDDAVLAAATRFGQEFYGTGWIPSAPPECEFGDFGERWRCEYSSGHGRTLVVLAIVDGGRVVGIESVEDLTPGPSVALE